MSNNKVRVEFDNVNQRDVTLKKLKSVRSLTAEHAKSRRPMVILKGITKNVNTDDLIGLIKKQNPQVADVVTSTDVVKLRFVRTNRNPQLQNVVLEVHPSVRVIMLDAGKVNIDHQRVRVTDFSGFLQCFKCLQFGHIQTKCTSEVEPCSHCASPDHTWGECETQGDVETLCCYNCTKRNESTGKNVDVKHSATAAKHCPRIKTMMARIDARTDYGTD